MKNLLRYSYKEGYMFIGDDFIYISSDKDHKELDLLNERNAKMIGKMRPSLLGKVMLIFSLTYFLMEFVVSDGFGLFTLLYILLGGPLLALWVYLYLSRGKVKEFKIPKSKVSSITEKGNSIIIHFVDKSATKDFIELVELQDEGILKLKELSAN